jgi:hypothetical protein
VVKFLFDKGAEADIIPQFRYYLVDQDAPLTAVRFRQALIESMNQLRPHPRIGSLVFSLGR